MFRDYYDGLQDPTDKELTYVRHTEFLPFDSPHVNLFKNIGSVYFGSVQPKDGKPLFPPPEDWKPEIIPGYGMMKAPKYSRQHPLRRYADDESTYTRVKIVFCGKLYIGIKYVEHWGDFYKPDPVIYWTEEAFLAHHESKDSEGKQDRNSRFIFGGNQRVDTFFTIPDEVQNRVMEACLDLKCPIMTNAWNEDERKEQTERGIINVRGAFRPQLNPVLKDYQFYRLFTAPQAFQELSMFLGGVIAHVDTPEPQSNRGKIEGHGFDYKDSFRKGPTKKH
jgi:hypothetical protein